MNQTSENTNHATKPGVHHHSLHCEDQSGSELLAAVVAAYPHPRHPGPARPRYRGAAHPAAGSLRVGRSRRQHREGTRHPLRYQAPGDLTLHYVEEHLLRSWGGLAAGVRGGAGGKQVRQIRCVYIVGGMNRGDKHLFVCH